MVVADPPVRVDQVLGRPAPVGKCAPDRVAVVEHDRVLDPEARDRLAHVAVLAREGELGRMHADHNQARLAVAPIPSDHVRQGADAIDAGVIPEIDQYHRPPALLAEPKRPALQPFAAVKLGCEDRLVNLRHRSCGCGSSAEPSTTLPPPFNADAVDNLTLGVAGFDGLTLAGGAR